MGIEDLLRKYVNFKFGVSAQGWNLIYCEVCGDGKREKGPRGGWLFDDEAAFYHCFNCGEDCSFDPNREYPYSKTMWKTLEAFGIPPNEHKPIADKNKIEGKPFEKPKERKIIKVDSIPIPDYFYSLADAKLDNIVAQKARKFLIEEKAIDPNSHTFFLSTGISKAGPREVAIAKSLINKLIIPSFKDGGLVYYQSRDLDKKKYLNPSIPRASIIYGFDKLNINIQNPLFVSEGFWDSHHLDGIAVLENRITAQQIDIIKKSPRRKIFVPDKKDDSKKLANQALELEWELGLPSIGNCEDVTQAVVKYGKIYVLNSLMNNIYSGFEASMKLNLY